MKKHEIKELIATKVEKIKKLKATLKRPHSELKYLGAGDMSALDSERKEIRVLYLVYAWYSGKSRNQVELIRNSEPPLYFIKSFFKDEPDHLQLFLEWLKS